MSFGNSIALSCRHCNHIGASRPPSVPGSNVMHDAIYTLPRAVSQHLVALTAADAARLRNGMMRRVVDAGKDTDDTVYG